MITTVPMDMTLDEMKALVINRQANCALCGRTADGVTVDMQLLPTVQTYTDAKTGDTKAMAQWIARQPHYFCCHEHEHGRRFDCAGKRLPAEIWQTIESGFRWSADDGFEHGYVLGQWEG